MDKIMTYRNKFRCLTLFLIRKKYLDQDLSIIDFTMMEGHDIADQDDGIDAEVGADLDSTEDFATPEPFTIATNELVVSSTIQAILNIDSPATNN